ncbi:flagellar biosynthetic protein FliO [Thermohalobacter berrensis]|uniref:Flagellar protein n=1 Tax=Thermohalobacter berrensis TaxID=99594 RepID=A0A419TAG6_9FIRM|nr:flagellar biosynthetic protein FliO [Thermohalobacter berrensis]RKD34447.1 hypothetical protein BET03_01030 [Thermohalobacter berrensis]
MDMPISYISLYANILEDSSLKKIGDTSILVSTFVYLLSFIVVVVLAYYFTKFMAKKATNYGSTSNIKVIDYISLDNSHKIVIVKIFNNVYILSLNNNDTTVVDKINETNINIKTNETYLSNNKFQNYLENIIEKFKTSKIDLYETDSTSNDKLMSLKNKIRILNKDQQNGLDKDESYD